MEQIEITKSGIKTSILAFISDYAISFFIFMFLIICYYYPVFNEPIKSSVPVNISQEVKVFILLLLLLLTYPIGILINCMSWICLGWMEKWFETLHFRKKSFLSSGTKNYLCFDQLVKHYNLDEKNFYKKCRMIEAHLLTNHEEQLSLYDESIGKSILFRNLTFCTLLLSIYFLIKWELLIFSILLVFSILFVLFNSIISFYYSLAVLLINWKYEEIAPKEKTN